MADTKTDTKQDAKQEVKEDKKPKKATKGVHGHRSGSQADQISNEVNSRTKPFTVEDIVEKTKLTKDRVRSHLQHLTDRGILTQNTVNGEFSCVKLNAEQKKAIAVKPDVKVDTPAKASK